MTIIRLRLSPKFFIMLIVSATTICIFITANWQNLYRDQNDWSLERIETELGVSIPEDAINIHYEGGWGRVTELHLSFQAPPVSMNNFTENFCGGELYQHYNPFRSINVATPLGYEHAVVLYSLYRDQYYSYSPSATDTEFGNSCFGEEGAIGYHILVNQSDPHLYTVRFLFTVSGLPYGLNNIETATVKPIAEFPLLIKGIWTEDHEHFAEGRMCFDIDPLAFIETDNWQRLIGAEITITIADDSGTNAHVSNQGLLTPEGEQANEEYFHYCRNPTWQDGRQEMFIVVNTVSGEQLSYSWEFYAR